MKKERLRGGPCMSYQAKGLVPWNRHVDLDILRGDQIPDCGETEIRRENSPTHSPRTSSDTRLTRIRLAHRTALSS